MTKIWFFIYNKNLVLRKTGFKQPNKKLFMFVHSCSCVLFSVKLDSAFMNIIMPACDSLWSWTLAYMLAALNSRDQYLDALCIGTFWSNFPKLVSVFWVYRWLLVTGKSPIYNPLHPTDRQQYNKIQQDCV